MDGLAAGIDLGGTKCLGVVVDERGSIVAEHRLPTPKGEEPVLETLIEVAQHLQSAESVSSLGIGAPGLVDRSGVLRYAPNLPGVLALPIADRVGTAVGLEVVVDNDANCAAWAERQMGAARQRDNAVLVTLGTGIGGGIIANGDLYRGEMGFAGEIGHMVVDPHGPPCVCGSRGCWERLASGSGLGRLGREAAAGRRDSTLAAHAGGDPQDVRGEHVTALAEAGVAEALEVLDEFAWWLALGLANLANLLDPESFVVGGGLIEAGDLLLNPVRAHFEKLSPSAGHRPTIEIVAAALGESAGAVGAALLGREGI